MWLVTVHHGGRQFAHAPTDEEKARRIYARCVHQYIKRWDERRVQQVKARAAGKKVDMRMGVRPQVRPWRMEDETT